MKRITGIVLALVLVLSFSLVMAVPVGANKLPDEVWVDLNFARDIDGVLSPGEWGTPLCTETGTYQTVTVYAHATMDALYLAFDTGDVTDNRGGPGLDVLDWNIGLVGSEFSPLACGAGGAPWRYVLVTKVYPDASWGDSWSEIDNGYYGSWGDTWNPNYYSPIPEGIEMVTSFGTGHRVTEFKVPMSLMFDGEHGWNGPSGGETLLLGGTYSGEDALLNFEMLWWPPGIDHCTEGTYATIEVAGRPSTPLGDHTFGLDAFVTIQGGINGVAEGGTVNVAAGTYTECVLVDVEGVTIEGESLDAVVDGGFELKADNITIDGLTIENGCNNRAIFTRGPSGPTFGSKGHQIINNELIGPGDTTGWGINIVACDDEPVNILVDNNKMHGWRIAIMLEGYSTVLTNNDIYENTKSGIDVERSCDNLISYNDICDNGQYGIYFGSVATTGNVVVYNNICGNGEYGIFNNSTGTVDAINNYWCSASGPSHSPGYGDPVSDYVLYDPWLLGPVVPGEPLPTTFDKTLALLVGWTLVSTDNWIDPAQTVGVGVILAYNYTPSLGYWEVTPAALVPVDALYLKTEIGGGVGIIYSGGVPVASSKDLEAGWNLISSATIDDAKAVLSPLRYIDVGEEQGIGLATLVSQGNYNQHSPSFYLATLSPADWNVLGGTTLNPFDGYWAYMNAAKTFGVVPD